MHDFIKLIVGAIFVCVLVVVFLIWDFNLGYPMRPAAFRDQIEALKPGMTQAQVKAKVTGWTSIDETSDTLTFTLSAERPGFLMPRVNQYINVEFDRDGKMTKVFSSDG